MKTIIVTVPDDKFIAPHCDARILHAPGVCFYCDKHPDWQKLRELWRINFTGQSDPDKVQCPAEARRSLEVINRWPGNIPRDEIK